MPRFPAGERPLRTRDLLGQLIGSLPEGVYVTDEAGAFLDANRALVDFLGVTSADDLRDRSIAETFDEPEAWAHRVAAARDGHGVWEVERTVRCFDGSRRSALDFGTVVRQPSGATVYQGVLVDVSRYAEREDELRRLLVRDPLTGCYNRRYLSEFVDEAHSEQDRWALLMVDLDDFKSFNDEHGHLEGDKLLQQMAAFLGRCLRTEDAVVRFGGDEFIVLLRNESTEHTERIAERLRAAAEAAAPAAFSLGAAVRRVGEPFEGTLARADERMRHVKVRDQRDRTRRRTDR